MSVDPILATPMQHVLTPMAPISVPAMMDSWEMDLPVKVIATSMMSCNTLVCYV